jgi:hypothetical protein
VRLGPRPGQRPLKAHPTSGSSQAARRELALSQLVVDWSLKLCKPAVPLIRGTRDVASTQASTCC